MISSVLDDSAIILGTAAVAGYASGLSEETAMLTYAAIQMNDDGRRPSNFDWLMRVPSTVMEEWVTDRTGAPYKLGDGQPIARREYDGEVMLWSVTGPRATVTVVETMLV